MIALFYMWLLVIATLLLKPFFFLKKKKIWFFIDRPCGIDNAYWIYKYCKKKWSQDIEHIYLCKNKDDQIYKNLENDEWVVFEFSARHFWTFVHADMYIYAYDTAPFYFNSFGTYFKRLLKPNTPLFFLSHGVSRGQLDTIMYENTYFDTFCSVWDREKNILESIIKQQHVIITWFPRFDILHQNKTIHNTIVFLPARRLDLSFGTQSDFKRSWYYKKIQSFLSSPKLHSILETYDTQLIWHPHQYIEDFLDMFDINHPNITLNIWNNKLSISQLFQQMWLFITDNSGAQFDAAYMKKPIIHYDFYPYHIDDMRLHEWDIWLFGDVYTKESDLIVNIETYLKNGYIMDQEYQKKVDNFFAYIDDKNCERVYHAMSAF